MLDIYFVKINYANPAYAQSVVLQNVKPNRTYKAFSGHLHLLKDVSDTFKVQQASLTIFLTTNKLKNNILDKYKSI